MIQLYDRTGQQVNLIIMIKLFQIVSLDKFFLVRIITVLVFLEIGIISFSSAG